jgi:hypothetical protein
MNVYKILMIIELFKNPISEILEYCKCNLD